jgi:hypothetical protein
MRIVTAATALALMLMTAGAAHAAEIVAPSGVPIVQTVVAAPAGADTILGSSTSRRYLCLMNIGTGLVTLAFDQMAAAGSGWALEGATTTGHQGGSMCWDNSIVAASTVHAISAAGSTIAVLEGR